MPTLLTPEAGGSAALRRRKAAAPTNYDAGWCCLASSSRLGLSDAGGRCAVAASASLVSMFVQREEGRAPPCTLLRWHGRRAHSTNRKFLHWAGRNTEVLAPTILP